MAHSKEYQRSNYPLPAYNFRVAVDGTAMSFAEVAGLHREYQTVTYRHGLSYWEGEAISKFRYDKYVSITMKRGTVKGVAFLYQWLDSKTVRTLDVSLCDETGTPVLRWHVAKAVPVKLDAPTFDARTSESAIETLEVKAAGISIVVEDLSA